MLTLKKMHGSKILILHPFPLLMTIYQAPSVSQEHGSQWEHKDLMLPARFSFQGSQVTETGGKPLFPAPGLFHIREATRSSAGQSGGLPGGDTQPEP